MPDKSRWLFREGKRRCHLCNQIKNLDEFYRRKTSIYIGTNREWRYECIGCNHVANKRYKFRDRFIRISGNTCMTCGIYHADTGFFDVDHIDKTKKTSKRRSGKASEKENLQVLCPNCHRLKGLLCGDIGCPRKSVV